MKRLYKAIFAIGLFTTFAVNVNALTIAENTDEGRDSEGVDEEGYPIQITTVSQTDKVFTFDPTDLVIWTVNVDNEDAIARPVITLLANTTITTGDGTQSNPYVVE